MSTVVLLPFSEIGISGAAIDKADNVYDLLGDDLASPALAPPAIVNGTLTGRGRLFGSDIGLVGYESAPDATRLTRDCTVRAFVKYETANAVDGDIGVVASRGMRDGTDAELQLFGLEIERVDAATLKLRMTWDETSGTQAATVGKEFVPEPDEFIFVAAARTWISATEVEVRYLVNGIALGVETLAAGDIDNGVNGALIVGAAGDGANTYTKFLPTDSIIDSLSIESDAMSLEELRQDYRRLIVHQPNGYAILRSYIPPGETYSKDESSKFRRWVKAEGAGLGLALAHSERYRDDFLPDRAYGEVLERWESLIGASPSVTATIEDRREEIINHFSEPLGFSYLDIQKAMAGPLGLDPNDVVIYEFGGHRSDDFSVDDITSPPSSLWATHQGNGSVSIVGGETIITSVAGENLSYHLVNGGQAAYREASLAPLAGEQAKECYIAVDTTLEAGADADCLAGVFVRNRQGDDILFCGVMDIGSGAQLYYFQEKHGVRSTPVTFGPVGATAKPYIARKTRQSEYEVGHVDGAGLRVGGDDVDGPDDPKWVGFGCFNISPTGGAADASFRDADIFEKNSTRGNDFIVYCDPALSSGYNLALARKILGEAKPAHTNGYVLDDLSGIIIGSGTIRLSPLQPRIL